MKSKISVDRRQTTKTTKTFMTTSRVSVETHTDSIKNIRFEPFLPTRLWQTLLMSDIRVQKGMCNIELFKIIY